MSASFVIARHVLQESTGVLINLGPFGSSHAGGAGLDVWAAAYLGIVGAAAVLGFARRDL